MKKTLFLLAAILCLVGCSDDDSLNNESKIDYPDIISGVWTDFLLFDGTERNITFVDSTHTAHYSAGYYSEERFVEELDVPFNYDRSKGEVVLNFSGIRNRQDIKEIDFSFISKDDMLGIIAYNDASMKKDTLLLTFLCEEFSFWSSPTSQESLKGMYDETCGPNSPEDLMGPLDWENPFLTTEGAEVKSRSITVTAMLTWVGKQIGTAAAMKLSGYGIDKILQQIIPNYDETGNNIKKIVQDMDIIKGKLDEINDKIDQLAKQGRIQEATKNLTDRNDRYYDLCISIDEAMKMIDAAVQDSTNSAASDSTIITNAILEWGDGMYHDNKRVNAAKVYVTKSLQAYGSYSYPELYDIFAYETNDWESKGYEWRDMLRTTDMALVSSAAEFTALYWILKNKINPDAVTDKIVKTQLQDLLTTIGNMDTLYSSNPVERHPDQMISQISGFHFVFDKKVEWRNLKNPTWYPKNTTRPISVEALVYGGGPDASRVGKERFLTENEYNKLCSYYSSSGGSVLQMFKEIGFDVNTTADLNDSRAMMVLPNGAYYTPTIALDRNDYVYFNAAIKNSSRKKETGVKVGEIYAPLVTNGDWWQNFLTNEKYFSHYVNYENHTWFNLCVLKRQ